MKGNTVRALSKKKVPEFKSPLGNNGLFMNFNGMADWAGNNLMHLNAIHDMRQIQTSWSGGFFPSLGEDGFPNAHDWVCVVYDLAEKAPVGLTNTPATPQGRRDPRFPIGFTQKCELRVRSVGAPFPISAPNISGNKWYWGMQHYEIHNIQLKDDNRTYTFDLKFTGPTPIMAGASNSTGFEYLIIPAYGIKLSDFDNLDKYDTEQYYHPDFLTLMKQWRGLRVMAYQQTNVAVFHSEVNGAKWESIKPSKWRVSRNLTNINGDDVYPILHPSHFVNFANAIAREPGSQLSKLWICIPHEFCAYYQKTSVAAKFYDIERQQWFTGEGVYAQVPEGYPDLFTYNLKQYLDYFLRHLDPKIQLYVELSNETWNYSFKQANFFNNYANSPPTKAISDAMDLAYDGNADANNARARCMGFFATKIAQVIRELESENNYGRSPSNMILAGQLSNIPTTHLSVMKYVEHITGKPLNETFYAISPAVYFSFDHDYLKDNGITRNTLKQAFLEHKGVKDWERKGRHEPPYYPNYNGIQMFCELADAYNIKAVAYEGGWDVFTGVIGGNNAKYFVEILMFENEFWDELFSYYINNLYAMGISEFFYFNVGPNIWPANNDNNFELVPLGIRTLDQPLISWRKGGHRKITPDLINVQNKVLGTLDEEQFIEIHYHAQKSHDANFFGPYERDGNFVVYGYLYYDFTDWDALNVLIAGNEYGPGKQYNPYIDMGVYFAETGTYRIWIHGYGGYSLKQSDANGSSTKYTEVMPATEVVVGETYKIAEVGTTDFTIAGAVANVVGNSFKATSTLTGTGLVYDPTSNIVDNLQTGFAGIKLYARKGAEDYTGGLVEKGVCGLPGIQNGYNNRSKSYIDVFFERGRHHLRLQGTVPFPPDASGAGIPGIITPILTWNHALVPLNERFDATSSSTLPLGNPDMQLYGSWDYGETTTAVITPNLNLTVNEYISFTMKNSLGTPQYEFIFKVSDYNPITGDVALVYMTRAYNTALTIDNQVTTNSNWSVRKCKVWETNVPEIDETVYPLDTLTVEIAPPTDPSGFQAEARVTSLSMGKIGSSSFEWTNLGAGYYEPSSVYIRDSSGNIISQLVLHPVKTAYVANEANYRYEMNFDFTECRKNTSGIPVYVTVEGEKQRDQNGEFIVKEYQPKGIPYGLNKISFKRIS